MGHEIDADYDNYNVPDWDGYGANPITPETVAFAREMMAAIPAEASAPHVAPGADGTIGLEWVKRNPTRKLFLDFGPGRYWSMWMRKGEWRELRATGSTDWELRGVMNEIDPDVYN